MNAFHQRIRADHELLAGGDVQNSCIVPDTDRASVDRITGGQANSLLQSADQVEFGHGLRTLQNRLLRQAAMLLPLCPAHR